MAERLASLAPFRRPTDLVLLTRVVAVGVSVPLLMRLPLPRLATVLSAATRRGRSDPRAAEPSGAEVAWLVACVEAAQRAGSPLIRSGCLTRGVTLYVLLRRAGVPVELLFGVGRVEGELAGHCWLARHGVPYLEPAGSPARFDAVYRIPPMTATAGYDLDDVHVVAETSYGAAIDAPDRRLGRPPSGPTPTSVST